MLRVGETASLSVSVLPDDASQDVQVTVDDPLIVRVDPVEEV